MRELFGRKWNYYLEQMIRELWGDEFVPPGERVRAEAQRDSVDGAEVVQIRRVVQLLTEFHEKWNLQYVVDFHISWTRKYDWSVSWPFEM